jgi:hypothetical protein
MIHFLLSFNDLITATNVFNWSNKDVILQLLVLENNLA